MAAENQKKKRLGKEDWKIKGYQKIKNKQLEENVATNLVNYQQVTNMSGSKKSIFSWIL